MIGVIVISHGPGAQGLICSAQMISPGVEQLASLCVNPDTNPDDFENELLQLTDQMNSGEGVLILADLLGGTPCNRAIRLLTNERVEILTGVNLPMLLTALTRRSSCENISDLLKEVCAEAHNGIVNLRELIKENYK
jgi:mannose/fructose-specific phosphotransferase system component IIA